MAREDSHIQRQFLDATIIIPTRRYELLTERCLQHCLKFFPGAEIVILTDQPIDHNRLNSKIIIEVTGNVSIAKKRNIGSNLSSRKFLAFIDSDAFPTNTWLSSALSHFKEQEETVAAICGPNVSPKIQTKSERLVGLITKSNLIVINAHFLKNKAPSRFVKSAPSCNLIVKKSIYKNLYGMDENLTGGEDFEFCNRLVKKGWKIFYSPDTLVYHKNRDLKNFFLQRLSYGGFSADRIGKDFSLQYWIALIPFLFVLFLLIGAVFLWFNKFTIQIIALITLYLFVVLIESIRVSETEIEIPLIFSILIFALITPGIGTLLQLTRLMPNYKIIYHNDK